jgi:NADPH-dependent 2,4-dienoyl-CoA reductase/sulfur reductase-like enzyme
MARRIVIIGGVACGTKAAARARRLDPEAEITIVEQGAHVSVGRCGIPYYVGGKATDIQQLFSSPVGVVRDTDFFQGVKNVRVLVKTRAERIDRTRKQVDVTDLSTGATETLPYDKLVLSTGARPLWSPSTWKRKDFVFIPANSSSGWRATRTARSGGLSPPREPTRQTWW